MYLVVLNHNISAGINGFYEQAILVKHMSLGFTMDSPTRDFINVEGFLTSPTTARTAARGEDIKPSSYSKRSQKEIDELIKEYFDTKTHKFAIPVTGIAYIEDMGN